MKISFKVLFVNFLVLLVLLLFLELIFGSWVFNKNQFSSLNIPNGRSWQYDVGHLYESNKPVITYTRDDYGLRGNLSFNEPAKIDILTIGGSTTDQRFIDDDHTWQSALQQKLIDHEISMVVANAGIDGHSSVAHLKSFDLWLNKIPNLKPKYIIYFVGINDSFIALYDDAALDQIDKTFISKMKENSALWNLGRMIKGSIAAKNSSAWHDHIVFEEQEYDTIKSFSQSEYKTLLGDKLANYEARLKGLVEKTLEMGAYPIFVTQPMANYKIDRHGVVSGITQRNEYGEIHFNGLDHYFFLKEMNQCIYRTAGNEYPVIELTDLAIWSTDDFYDFIHMNPTGNKKLGNMLAKELIESGILNGN